MLGWLGGSVIFEPCEIIGCASGAVLMMTRRAVAMDDTPTYDCRRSVSIDRPFTSSDMLWTLSRRRRVSSHFGYSSGTCSNASNVSVSSDHGDVSGTVVWTILLEGEAADEGDMDKARWSSSSCERGNRESRSCEGNSRDRILRYCAIDDCNLSTNLPGSW